MLRDMSRECELNQWFSYVSHCCGHVPEEKQPRRGRLYSDSQFKETQFTTVGKPCGRMQGVWSGSSER